MIVPLLATAGGSPPPDEGQALTPFIEMAIPRLAGYHECNWLRLSFFGLGIASTGATTLKQFFEEGRDVIEILLVKLIIPLLRFYIAGVFAELAAAGTVFETLKTFGVILVLAVSLHWLLDRGALYPGRPARGLPHR